MKITGKILSALTIGAALTTPANAVPIIFDLAGTVSQHSVVDAAGEQWNDDAAIGTAWNAQFVVETDLFGPRQTGSWELGQQAGFTGLPGGVTASLTIGGEVIDVARFNTDTSLLRSNDSLGLVYDINGFWSIATDQWGVNFRSREITAQGTAGIIDFQMGFGDNFDVETLSGGTEMFSIDDITSPYALVMLPYDGPGYFRDVEYTVEDFICNVICESIGTDNWSLGLTSVTRTVGGTSVPEPGTLALFAAALGGMALRRRRRVL